MKKIVTLCLSLMMVLSLIACGSKTEVIEKGKDNEEVRHEEVKTEEPTEVEEPSGEVAPENEAHSDMSKSETVAYDFVKAVQSGDYETASSFLDIDTTYITTEDFGWFIPRSSLGDLVDSTYELKDVGSEGTKPNDVVTLTVGPVTATINTFLNDDNEWKVNFDEAFIKDWKVIVPKGMALKINATEVDKNLISITDERYDTYTIPYVVLKEAELVASSETLGDFTVNTLPSNEEYKVSCQIEDTDEIFEELRQTLNAINEVYENGARETSEFSQFISDSADVDFATTLVNSVDTQYTWNSGSHPTNIRYARLLPRVDDPEYMPCFAYTADKIGVNLRVEKTWDDDYSSTGNRIYGWVVFERTPDGIKLAGLPADRNIITARNNFDKDWSD